MFGLIRLVQESMLGLLRLDLQNIMFMSSLGKLGHEASMPILGLLLVYQKDCMSIFALVRFDKEKKHVHVWFGMVGPVGQQVWFGTVGPVGQQVWFGEQVSGRLTVGTPLQTSGRKRQRRRPLPTSIKNKMYYRL
jgi:hypothetical protein